MDHLRYPPPKALKGGGKGEGRRTEGGREEKNELKRSEGRGGFHKVREKKMSKIGKNVGKSSEEKGHYEERKEGGKEN